MDDLDLKSPVSGEVMERVTLEGGLRAHRCPVTGGHYITSRDYMQWLFLQPARLPHLPAPGISPPAPQESEGVLFCPETGTLMTRYKVGHGFPFSLDRSITGGVWLDGGEWEALKARNFHDEIHLVFTAPWQQHVRDAKSLEVREATMESLFGPELFGRLTSLRHELTDHANKSAAIAYLSENADTEDTGE